MFGFVKVVNGYKICFVRALAAKTVMFIVKALKSLVWHLSREPMKEMSSLKR